MKYPLVSVVIPAYNEADFIGKTLKSLQNQDYKGVYEVIVVNNNSKDETARIAQKFNARVIHEPRKGVQHARQAGFEAANGEFIASTDSDDVLPPHWISQMAERLIEKPNLVAVGGWIYHKEGEVIPKFIINRLSGTLIVMYKNLSRKKFLVGQNFMIRKSAFMKTKGFTDIPEYCEDLNLAKRISKFGELEFHTSKIWSVETSPRRWSNGFALGMIPYLINGISFAVMEKVAIKNLGYIRTETSSGKLYLLPLTTTYLTNLVNKNVPALNLNSIIIPRAQKAKNRIVEEFKKFSNY